MDPQVALLLESIDRGYNLASWHGPNLRGSLKGVTSEMATRRPLKGRHSIWEVMVHCAYWKYIVRRRILGEPRGSFPLKGSNWFVRPAGGENRERAWREDLRLLDEVHRSLREAIAACDPRTLSRKPAGSRSSTRVMILGIAAHDLYHAGQIQLVKKMTTGKGRAKKRK
jgi:uncharacterized damage-inducible protein DinB